MLCQWKICALIYVIRYLPRYRYKCMSLCVCLYRKKEKEPKKNWPKCQGICVSDFLNFQNTFIKYRLILEWEGKKVNKSTEMGNIMNYQKAS